MLPADDRTTITLAAGPAAWTARKEGEVWHLYDAASTIPNADLALSTQDAALLFSRGMPAIEVARHVVVRGDADLGSAVVAGLAAFFGTG